jgi:protease-4
MLPRTRAAALAAAILLASPASAQVQAGLDREAGIPAGLVLPVLGAAAAEEPTALGTNPAGAAFVRDLGVFYLHEGRGTPGSEADGIYAATVLGPLATGLSLEWVRPGEEDLPRYRRTKLALGLTDGHSLAATIAWNFTQSGNPDLDDLAGWDAGVAWRPGRHLALGASALGIDAFLGDTRLPVRYDIGLATRFLDDTYTFAADLLANDRSRNDFHPTHVAFGLGAEWRAGFGLGVQVQVPITDEAGVRDEVSTLLSLAWNARHAGFVGGGASLPDGTSWFAGARLSGEAYRSAERGNDVPVIDVDDVLEGPRGLLALLRAGDPYLDLVRRLQKARDDDEVAGLVIVVSDLSTGLARTEELRGLVASVRAVKPVLVYLRGGGMKEYLLASAGSKVASPPGATLLVNGVGTSRLFLRGGLERLGVSFDVVRAGDFKSAPEPLVRHESSPEAREMTNAILDDVYAREVEAIAAGRRLEPSKVRALVDRGLFSAEEAAAAGLLDAVMWPDEIDGWVRREIGRRARASGPYEPTRPRAAQRWGAPAVIAVVPVEGTILPGRAGGVGEDVAGAKGVARSIRAAAADRSVRAIVLRVDSPGGDALASDLLWREVVRARRRKPVVAWTGDAAASGGYLVAVAADVIVAQPSTLTGSIGVFALKPDLSGALAKLSLSREAYARGELAQIRSIGRPWSQAERAAVEGQVQAFYRSFVDRVAEGRKMTREEVEAVAGGRVWTGQQAHERRLVDRLGTFADAVALARERAGLAADDEIELVRLGPGARLTRIALGALAGALAPEPGPDLDVLFPELATLSLLARMGPLLALPPGLVEPLPSP